MNVLYRKISTFLHDPRIILEKIIFSLRPLVTDVVYLKLLFLYRLGYSLDLRHPQTYSQKLQWIKLFDHNPLYTRMVDKFEVKDYVRKLIGDIYVIPNYGIWDSPEQIDWERLPNQFIIKTTHGCASAGNIICKDKKLLDKTAVVKKIRKALKQNTYSKYLEWPYKNIRPRILAEQLLIDHESVTPKDYKFYCFNGVPKVVVIASERYVADHTYFDYFDMNGNHLPFTQGGKNNPCTPELPTTFEEMKSIAALLSKGIPQVRVDLYSVNGKVYFGEMTFFDSSGFARFEPIEWDYTFGGWITLPNKNI